MGYSRALKQAKRGEAPLGTGQRFAQLENTLSGKGIKSPGALAAYIGRKKYGKTRFQNMAKAGRKK